MASVHRRTKDDFFQAKFRFGDDILWLSTKLKNKPLALQVAQLWQQACLDAENLKFTPTVANRLAETVFKVSKCAKTRIMTEKLVNRLLKESGQDEARG